MVNTRDLDVSKFILDLVKTPSSWPCFKALELLVKGPGDCPFSCIFVHVPEIEYPCLDTGRCLRFSFAAKSNDCVRFFALILSLLLNPLAKRFSAASDNQHSVAQLIVRHAVSNYLMRQTAFLSLLDESSAKLLSEVHHKLDTVQWTVCTSFNLLHSYAHQWVQVVVKYWFIYTSLEGFRSI